MLQERWREEYSYDTNGNMIERIDYDWNSDSGSFNNYTKLNFTYDLTNNLSDIILYQHYLFSELFFPEFMVNKPIKLSEYDWDKTNNEWFESSYESYYFSDKNVTNADYIENEDISLYPNPVSEHVNVSFTSNSNSAIFEMFDLHGRKLMSKEVMNNEQVSLEHLSNGMYLYNICIKGKWYSGKLIKK